jgi:phage terminase Nu1 subunit (DNA packaging protein)
VSGILRLRARPTKELEERLLKVEVESGEDLERLAAWLGAPIVEGGEGDEAVVDARDMIMYYRGRR